MHEMATTALAGTVAGLGVAMPLGAMGVLLVQESMRSRRRAVAAATAVAVADLGYAALATAVGPLVAAVLTGIEAWVRLLAALVLGAIACHGLWASRGSELADPVVTLTDRRRTPTAREGAEPSARVFLRYLGLTAINPTTALYFAALTTAQGARLGSGAAGVLFVTAVFLASLAWQQLLVAAGSFAGSRISPTARAWTFRVGYGLVALYAVKIALPFP
ncbi:hypothetical protein [Streptomyces sp. NPDC006879]|uniref:hypothetical protein n=1 Tax=Streptomyces sp. NPDC006879 TaxID=3364767 RepID=UPI00368C9D8F